MSALRRLVCALFGHRPERGLNRTFCFRFSCTRCGTLASGDLLTTRSRP